MEKKRIRTNDPIYLSEEASLGVLSVVGNLYGGIITKAVINIQVRYL